MDARRVAGQTRVASEVNLTGDGAAMSGRTVRRRVRRIQLPDEAGAPQLTERADMLAAEEPLGIRVGGQASAIAAATVASTSRGSARRIQPPSSAASAPEKGAPPSAQRYS